MAKAQQINWPDNVVASGILNFPIIGENNIEQLKEWRTKKGHKKPKYPDKIGATIFINDATLKKVLDYLENVYIPFAFDLYKQTGGDKGIEPELIKALETQIKERDWSGKNFPIRDLTEKDKEQLGDFPAVAKLRINGPYQADFAIKGVIKTDEGQRVTDLDYLRDEQILPESRSDETALWWGSGWPFRISMRMNAFEGPNGPGISAYVDVLYLLAYHDLPVLGGGNSDAEVLGADDDDSGWA